ncbi:hypothetical protein M514_13855 [Trichuris suis]|uniref:Uncharacterized protein n=1 Tax=Trichuris suis TaxID=68888 RepID=A0A085MR10_9BILA|nr:hypothetical protein M514_13855 [Trichuris suis]
MENPAPIIVRIQKIREYGYVFVAWIDGRVMCGVGNLFSVLFTIEGLRIEEYGTKKNIIKDEQSGTRRRIKCVYASDSFVSLERHHIRKLNE